MAQDEGRFGRISEARRCWAPPGVRPTCPRQVVRESLYVFAAIAPASGEMTALILPYCDTEAMNLFLRTLSGEFAGRLVLLQTDRAGWHRSAALRLPDNVRLFYQPSHSPELNPVEHLWDDLRSEKPWLTACLLRSMRFKTRWSRGCGSFGTNRKPCVR
jgi:transposase